MTGVLAILAVGTVAIAGCGGGACSQGSRFSTGHPAVFVANTGSGTISAFQNPGPNEPAGGVRGSPFPVGRSPQAILYYQAPL
jgi:hypothetical protein